MIREVLWRSRMQMLANGLDAFSARQRTIASNIANSEVSGYKPKRVQFEEQLQRALGSKDAGGAKTHPNHFPLSHDPHEVRYNAYIDEDASYASGINDVNVDLEMAQLATTRIQYDLTAMVAKRRFEGMSRMIRSVKGK
jgi:flagellar basal-body rod protein FlgB